MRTTNPPTELHRRLAYQRLFGYGRQGWRPMHTGGDHYGEEYMVCRIQPDPKVAVPNEIYAAISSILQELNVVGHVFKGDMYDRTEMVCVPRKSYERYIEPKLDRAGPGQLHYQQPSELLLTNTVDGLLTQRIRETMFHLQDLWTMHVDAQGGKHYELSVPRASFNDDLPYDAATLDALGDAMVRQDFKTPGLSIHQEGDALIFTMDETLVERIQAKSAAEGPRSLVGNVEYIEELRARAQAKPTRG